MAVAAWLPKDTPLYHARIVACFQPLSKGVADHLSLAAYGCWAGARRTAPHSLCRKSCTGSAICSSGFDTLTAELLRVIQGAMQPETVSVRLRE